MGETLYRKEKHLKALVRRKKLTMKMKDLVLIKPQERKGKKIVLTPGNCVALTNILRIRKGFLSNEKVTFKSLISRDDTQISSSPLSRAIASTFGRQVIQNKDLWMCFLCFLSPHFKKCSL